MIRKVIKQGNHSFTLTLPITWIKESCLESGDEVTVAKKDSSLVLSVLGQKKPEHSLSIDFSLYDKRSITIILHQAYRKGLDTINIKYKDSDQLSVIQNLVRKTLLGFEVIHEGENSCSLQNIAEPTSDKFDLILQKQLLLLKEETIEILTEMKAGTYDSKKRQENRDFFVNFNNFTRRAIIKDGVPDGRNSYLLFNFVSNLSLIKGSYYYLHKISASVGKKSSEVVLSYLEKLNNCVLMLYDAYYAGDVLLAHETRTVADCVLDDLYGEVCVGGEDSKQLAIMSNIARMIGVSTTVLFGLKFD